MKEAYRTRDKGKGPGEEWKEEGKRREGKSRRINEGNEREKRKRSIMTVGE